MNTSERYCASRDVIALLERDGIGWGHDIDCGCFHMAPQPKTPGLARRIAGRLTGKG